MVEQKALKSVKKYICENCDGQWSRKADSERHLSTRKHKMIVNGSNLATKSEKKYFCECGKSYTHDSGYYRHKKTCTFISAEKESNNDNGNGGIDKEILLQVIQNQNNLQNLVVKEIIPKIGNNNNNTNCNNTTNKFNMNIFLNETCKDAMPLMDFINNLKLSVEDLDNTGKEGLVKGLTDIITKGLNDLDVTKRPIHCSDIKRETLYIKDEDKWIKDDKDKSMVSHAIRKVKRDADRFFPKWLEQHPNCWDQESPYHEQYMTMVTNRFGKGEENFQEKNTKKVIKNIAKEVIVDKENIENE